jgi:hypothetical protein
MVFENLVALWIAVEKQCPPETAFKWLDNYLENGDGFKKKPKFSWTREDVQDVIRLREGGVAWKEIADCYGLKMDPMQSTICRKRKEMGI